MLGDGSVDGVGYSVSVLGEIDLSSGCDDEGTVGADHRRVLRSGDVYGSLLIHGDETAVAEDYVVRLAVVGCENTVVGDVQVFGSAVNFGGPYGGFIACLDKYKRQLAGRIVGRTLDADGNQAFTLTLQTREQHIRREKATSNICSNQGLVALCAAVYMTVMGKDGVKQAAYLSAKNAHMLADGLKKNGIKILNKNFFNEFVIEVENSDDFLKKMKAKNILAGIKLDDKKVLVTVTEMNTEEEIERYLNR